MADSRTPRQKELDELSRLPSAVSYQAEPDRGVLLSDRIQQYVDQYRMIWPFNPQNLKPAAYELSVGELYSVGGTIHNLSNAAGARSLRIEPFEVAIIQTLERVNIPNFLIGRWNIRVGWAYKGLLWVGGPQVDPGFKGFLSCPIYNLSNEPVTLRYGEPLAVIDFVTTTTPQVYSKRYQAPDKRTRLIFDDYNPSMQSALARLANEKLVEFEARLEALQRNNNSRSQQMQTRIDAFTGITFTAIAILVGAVAVVASKNSVAEWNSTFGLASIAILISLLCIYLVRSDTTRVRKVPWIQLGSTLIVLILVYTVLDLFVFSPPSKEVKILQDQAKSSAAEITDLRKQLKAIQSRL